MQPLKPYLVERYRYGRTAQWRAEFYPERVRLNNAAVTEESWVRPGDIVSYRHLRAEEPLADQPLAVLYEDEAMLVVHKPDTVPVSPSGLYYFTSLALRAREAFAQPELTPIHRLDLETSGPLVLAKRKVDLPAFHRLFTEKRLHKVYRALVQGRPPAALTEMRGRILPDPASRIHTKLRLDAQAAEPDTLTRILCVVDHGECSEVEVRPLTGKTNQIRVHLAAVGHAIVGDKKYHPDEAVFLDWLEHRDFSRLRERLRLPRQALQCQALEFPHPLTGQPVSVRALPGSWAAKVWPVVQDPLPD
ncbi:MAG TPA: RluA family pseudouridine synthase [bacterium]|nr:RluA family pseudouridine synthase [bacterium]